MCVFKYAVKSEHTVQPPSLEHVRLNADSRGYSVPSILLFFLYYSICS